MLSSITFSGSKLTRIPKELANCTRLETLQISNNPITSIPTELTQLTNLEILDIYGTQIPEEEVQRLVKLFPEGVVKGITSLSIPIRKNQPQYYFLVNKDIR